MHSKEIYKKIDIFSSSLAFARKKDILIESLPIGKVQVNF